MFFKNKFLLSFLFFLCLTFFLVKKHYLFINKGKKYRVNGFSYTKPSKEPFGCNFQILKKTTPQDNEKISSGFLIPYRKKDKWGYADRQKNIVIEPKYNMAFPFEGNIAKVEDKDRGILINKRGEELMSSKDYIDILESNLIKIYCSQTYNGAGIIDLQGKLIIPFDYNIIDYYPNQKVFIGRIFEGGSESDKLFFLDIHGKKILPMSFKDISLSEDNLFALQTKNDKCFFVDSGGNLKIPEFNCSYNYTFSDGLRIFEEKRKYGYMNKEGKIIIPAKYCYAYNFSNGWGLVMDGEKENCSDRTSWMFLDKKGNTILTLSYSDYYHVSDLNELGLIPVCKGEGCGYVNKQGVIVIPLKYFPGAKYSGLSNIYDKYLMVDTLEYISNKTVFRSGVLDSYGNVVIPLIYKTLTFTETNLLYACKDDFHCGFIDFKNNPVIPFKYSISFGPYGYQDLGFKNDISVCLKKTDKEKCDETHVGYIDMQGNEFWE